MYNVTTALRVIIGLFKEGGIAKMFRFLSKVFQKE